MTWSSDIPAGTGLRATALAPLLAVAACSDSILTMPSYHGSNPHGRFLYGSELPEFLTVVVNNPFPVSKATLDTAVTDAMQGHHIGPRTRFTTRPSARMRPGFRVVMLFNPPLALPDSALCGDTGALASTAPGPRLRLVVAFCAAAYVESTVQASMPVVPSPDHPGFRQMIGQAMWDLVPARDPADESSHGCKAAGTC